ncbi:MAG TPA: pitrilysin family protein [Nannocystis sp.]|jgi:zinc protease
MHFNTVKILILAVALGGCQKQQGTSTPPVKDTGTSTPAAEQKATSDRQAQEAAAKRAQLAALPPLPGVEAARAVKFPEPQIQTLPNGLELVVLEDHEVPKLRVSAFIKAGHIYAPGDQPSLAEFTLLLLGEGTKKRDKASFDAQVDATGGDIIAAIDDEVAGVTADVLARDASFAFTAVAEQVMQPALPETSLKKIKDQLLQGVDVQKASPFGLSSRMAARAIYGEESPYGRPFPTTPQIEGMTREQALAFHAKHYQPGNAMLVVAGDITPRQARKLADRAFGTWRAGQAVPVPKAAKRPLPAAAPVVYIVDRKASAQASVLALVAAPGIGEPGWLQIRVLQQLLGGGLSGRLNMVLREQLGLTYGAGAFHSFGYDGGAFFAGGSTKTKSAAEFTQALVNLLRQPSSEAVEAVELRRLLSKISGQFALEVEGMDTVSMKTVQQRLFGLPPDFWERYRSDVESISADDLKRTTQSLLVDQAVQIVVVGRADKLRKELAGFGEVRVYDTDLKRID